MLDVIYLAWRYLSYYRVKTLVLVASMTLILYLPVGLNTLFEQSARQLRKRAASTPLLIGARGSPLELVLNALYFESDVPAPLRYAEAQRVEQSGLANAIPLYTRFRTRHSPIVGTTVDYFTWRGLEIAQGRQLAVLGECVLGASAARACGAQPGDAVVSAATSLFDIAGAYPLRMHVVGVLQPAGTPDDDVVFVDLKTAWVIQGLAHGHQDLSRPEAGDSVLRREADTIVANAAVVQYNEITPENIGSFHFHGDPADFPITSVIALPHDRKSGTLLEGTYVGPDESVQIVLPTAVMDTLLETVLTVRRHLIIAVTIVGLSTLATMTLVFLLSLQLRRREMATLVRIGAARPRIAGVVAAEALGVLTAGAILATALCLLTGWFAPAATRLLIQLA
jgi:putative ABC transport system permease protein